MWKTVTAISAHILAIVLVIVFCAGSATEQQAGVESRFDGELERNVTLHILENDTAIEQGYVDELLAAFNVAYKDYGIKAVDANMDQYLDLEKDGPYGYGPDVLYQANDMLMKYVDGRHILPLPVEQLDCYDKLDTRAWDAYKAVVGDNGGGGVQETYYCGVPVNIQGPLLYYRKDLLPENWETEWDDNRNNVPDMIESWNAMYAYSNQIKAESGGKKFGYMKSLNDQYFASGYLFSYGGYIFGENNTDPSDIGLAAGDAEKGASVIRQLASSMNEECIDDTITVNAYSKLANGTYFATMTTPDVYTLFIKELTLEYQKSGLSKKDAEKKAEENLVVTDIPDLPASGDLSEKNPELIPCKMMGGVNGYAVSAYTKAPNACLAFIDFATQYDRIMRRNALLGIAPARTDAAAAVGGLSETVNRNLSEGKIVVMPSVRAVAQVWGPLGTLLADIAKDPFRTANEMKFNTLPALKTGLEKTAKQVYDAIFTLQ